MIKITYRGWPGHFICGSRCVFHLNTLIESGDTKVVVSTVGNFRAQRNAKAEEIGAGRYYETMVFRAALKDGYWDQDSGCNLSLHGRRSVDHIGLTADQEAQEMHEAAVQEIVRRIRAKEDFNG